jgi:hypothetical protein
MSTRVSTIVTPSARSRERVTGRWTREFDVQSPREKFIYWLKLMFGTPVPWLLWAYVSMAFMSRAGVEIAAWGCAGLTLLYVTADRFSRTREISLFRVGADLFLLGYFMTAVAGAFFADTPQEGLWTLGGARWVILLYLVTHCLELFPGLNRLYQLMVGSAAVAAVYGIWQHFTGVDLLRDTALASAPLKGEIYFISSGFFSTPEVLGTVIAMTLPFPAAAFLMAGEKDGGWSRWAGVLLSALFGLAVMWTYRPGLWMAAFVSVVILVLLQARNSTKFISVIAAFFIAAVTIGYSSPEASLTSIQEAETVRAERQRAQINTQVQLWQEGLWIGSGRKALEAANYDPGTGNVYFQVLAQSGVLGGAFYLLFILAFLLLTYRLFQEIPRSHYWHRVMLGGALASQIAFHVAGLYWSTLTEAATINLFVLVVASVSYLNQHYGRGLVPDDHSL